MSVTIKRSIALAVIAAGATIASTGAAQAATYPSYSTQYAPQKSCVELRVQPGTYVPAANEEWCLTFDGKQGIRAKATPQPGIAVPSKVQPGILP